MSTAMSNSRKLSPASHDLLLPSQRGGLSDKQKAIALSCLIFSLLYHSVFTGQMDFFKEHGEIYDACYILLHFHRGRPTIFSMIFCLFVCGPFAYSLGDI